MKNDRAPAFQFYVRDWLADLALRKCSREARSIWIDALCYMWLEDEKGVLRCNSFEELCLIFGDSPLVDSFIRELITHKVCDFEKPATLINRRMKKEQELSEKRSEIGRSGGMRSGEVRRSKTKQTPSKTKQNFRSKVEAKTKQRKIIESSVIVDTCDIEGEPLNEANENQIIEAKRRSSSSSASSSALLLTSDPGERDRGVQGGQTKRKTSSPSPIVDGCVYFRLSEARKAQVQRQYQTRGIPLDVLPIAILEVDRWLQSDSTKAIRARSALDHGLRLYDNWAIENALKSKELDKKAQINGHKNPGDMFRQEFGFIPSARERDMIRSKSEAEKFLDRVREQALLEDKSNET